MKPKRSKLPAILIHDGAQWHLPGQKPVSAPLDAPPAEWLKDLAKTHAAVRFLLVGDIRRQDVALPPRAKWAEAQTLVAQELADQTGGDSTAWVIAGRSYGEGRGAAVIAGVFETGRLAALRDAAAEAGLRFAGVAALSLAVAAAWRAQPAAKQMLVIVGSGEALVVPPAPAAPQPVPAGLRHAAVSPEAWLERFSHGTRGVGADTPLRLLTLGGEAEPLVKILHEQGGFADVQALAAEPTLKAATALAASANANSLRADLPVANPWVPRKRFSNAWIVLPCIALLALPYLYSWHENRTLAAETARYQTEAAQYLPLEQSTDAAQKRKAAAQRAYDNERATQQTLAARRRPLAAFVQVAYFFCRNAEPSLVLDTLTEQGGIVTATGTYVDDDEGLRLRAALTVFAEAEGLRLANTKDEAGKDAEGLPIKHFSYTIDCTRMGDTK